MWLKHAKEMSTAGTSGGAVQAHVGCRSWYHAQGTRTMKPNTVDTLRVEGGPHKRIALRAILSLGGGYMAPIPPSFL